MIGYFLWWVTGKVRPTSLCVCLYVSLSVFDSGEKMPGLIGTGDVPLDTPERGKDDGADCGGIRPNRHVPRTAA